MTDLKYLKRAHFKAVWREVDAGGWVVMVHLDDFHATHA